MKDKTAAITGTGTRDGDGDGDGDGEGDLAGQRGRGSEGRRVVGGEGYVPMDGRMNSFSTQKRDTRGYVVRSTTATIMSRQERVTMVSVGGGKDSTKRTSKKGGKPYRERPSGGRLDSPPPSPFCSKY